MTLTLKEAKKLVDEAGELDTICKEKGKRLKEIKETLAKYYEATKTKEIEAVKFKLKISTTDMYDDLDPLAVYNNLEKYGEQGKLFSIIKVEMKKLREILPAKDIDALQGKSTGEKVSLKFVALG